MPNPKRPLCCVVGCDTPKHVSTTGHQYARCYEHVKEVWVNSNRKQRGERTEARPMKPFPEKAKSKAPTVKLPLHDGRQVYIGPPRVEELPRPSTDALRRATLQRIASQGPKSSDSPVDVAESGWTPKDWAENLRERFA